MMLRKTNSDEKNETKSYKKTPKINSPVHAVLSPVFDFIFVLTLVLTTYNNEKKQILVRYVRMC